MELGNGINIEQVNSMVDAAIESGINYYDTAWTYHKSLSEVVIGRSLSRHPRDSWNLATKFPGHQYLSSYDAKSIFEKQLKKCGVEYFDFYLLHNVSEGSIETYENPEWGIIDYLVEQKKVGRIRHLGFSSHGRLECIQAFVARHKEEMEFCQIQLNYLDWTLQKAKSKYEFLTEQGIPVWVMEPLRGGKLAHVPELGNQSVAFAFRFLQGLENVKMILSGMSTPSQLAMNTQIFEKKIPLLECESTAVLHHAEILRNAVPCTACNYCIESCPVGLNISVLIEIYNNIKVHPSANISMFMDTIPLDRRPLSCIACGACKASCPQEIDIPEIMANFVELEKSLPNWEMLSRERELVANKIQ